MARRQGRGSTVARDRAGKAVRTAAVPAQQASMTGASRSTRATAGVPRVAREGGGGRTALGQHRIERTTAATLGQAAPHGCRELSCGRRPRRTWGLEKTVWDGGGSPRRSRPAAHRTLTYVATKT